MRKHLLSVALVCALCGSLVLPSCIGSFSLTNKLLTWNRHIDNKFVNELVFVAFWILPVYPVSGLADILVLNSIEFWSGESPVAQGKTMIDGKDGKYLVDCDGNGYTITSMNDGTSVRLDFNAEERSWSYTDAEGRQVKLLTFIDDTHVRMPAGGDTYRIVELSDNGLQAYRQAVLSEVLMAAR